VSGIVLKSVGEFSILAVRWEPLGGIVMTCWSISHFPISFMFLLYRCSLSRGLLEVP
jgi:hypothetical protein